MTEGAPAGRTIFITDPDTFIISPSVLQNLIQRELKLLNSARPDFAGPVAALIAIAIALASSFVSGVPGALALWLMIAIGVAGFCWLAWELRKRARGDGQLAAGDLVDMLKGIGFELPHSEATLAECGDGLPAALKDIPTQRTPDPPAQTPVSLPGIGLSHSAAHDRVRHMKLGDGAVLGYEQEGPLTKVIVQFDDQDLGIKAVTRECLTYLSTPQRRSRLV